LLLRPDRRGRRRRPTGLALPPPLQAVFRVGQPAPAGTSGRPDVEGPWQHPLPRVFLVVTAGSPRTPSQTPLGSPTQPSPGGFQAQATVAPWGSGLPLRSAGAALPLPRGILVSRAVGTIPGGSVRSRGVSPIRQSARKPSFSRERKEEGAIPWP